MPVRTALTAVLLAALLWLPACSNGDPVAPAASETAGNMAMPPAAAAPERSAGTRPGAAPAGQAGSAAAPHAGQASEQPPSPLGDPAPDATVVPLFGADTALEPEVLFDRGDAIVTRFGDRARDRHAREEQFQSYDHYLPHYWDHRTARFLFVDRVAKGGSTLEVSFVTEWKLGPTEFRAWYSGMGSVAHYHGNYAPLFEVEGPGSYDEDHQRIGDGVQYKHTYTIASAIDLNGKARPLALGQFMEIEVSQFLDGPPVGRENYYGTVFLYEIGRGGLVPWHALGDFEDKASERENSHPLPERAWLGGRTTLHQQYSDEPDNHFMQMATNLSGLNAQPFVRGRRIHHTDMLDGSHDESAENGVFAALVGLAGPRYVNRSCDSCHTRNGRAPVAAVGESLERWVFKLGTADGASDPLLGAVLQPRSIGGAASEGSASIAGWSEDARGLRAPKYAFSGRAPERFSARIAPALVGLGLLEAVAESTVLALADADDADGDGISGRAQIVPDPASGQARLGRFGWKAGASSLRHQIANALNTDMGVMTSLRPKPDCGQQQADCGDDAGAELSDEQLSDLVKYVALLGVRARRDVDGEETLRGEALFERVGCSSCHVPQLKTGDRHPFAELRAQLIHPYSDLLLHDLGPGLADELGEGVASGSEWRTTPLWGLGLSACVTGGVEGPFQQQVCTPDASYLHDGRARTIDEAILWHGGEGEAARDAFAALPAADRTALLAFLQSL